MKSFYRIIPLLLLFVLPLMAQDVDLEAEKEAIKNVCRQETMASFKGDAYTRRSFLTDEHELVRVGYSEETAHASAWHAKLDPNEKPENPESHESSPYKIENEDYVFHIGRDVAWVSYNQTVTEPATDRDITWTMRENRTLRKENGQWKIVNIGTFGTGCDDPQLFHVKQKLTDISNQCIQAKDTEKAIRVAELALELFPESAHAYDALAWAYYNQGDKEKTIEYAQKALDQLPNDTFTPPRWHEQIQKWAEEKFELAEQIE